METEVQVITTAIAVAASMLAVINAIQISFIRRSGVTFDALSRIEDLEQGEDDRDDEVERVSVRSYKNHICIDSLAKKVEDISQKVDQSHEFSLITRSDTSRNTERIEELERRADDREDDRIEFELEHSLADDLSGGDVGEDPPIIGRLMTAEPGLTGTGDVLRIHVQGGFDPTQLNCSRLRVELPKHLATQETAQCCHEPK